MLNYTNYKKHLKLRSIDILEIIRILEKQIWHLAFVVISIILFAVILPFSNFLDGELFGRPTLFWVINTISFGILHQVYVLFCWRIQLKYQWFTKKLGQKGFQLYVLGFFILFFARIISVFLTAYSNLNSLNVQPIILYIIAGLISVPMIYSFYSVGRFFGMYRAAGADHFDPTYKNKPFVKQGIYKYTDNAMYKFALLIIWIPGLIFASESALLLALFNHLHVWVHYYTLELPDIQKIYGTDKK